jgi:acyl carrier protein
LDTTEIKGALNDVFRDVFDDESISVTEQTTARDVQGWDSLTHINLVVATEKRFGVKFTTREVQGLANVGELIELIAKKLRA